MGFSYNIPLRILSNYRNEMNDGTNHVYGSDPKKIYSIFLTHTICRGNEHWDQINFLRDASTSRNISEWQKPLSPNMVYMSFAIMQPWHIINILVNTFFNLTKKETS